MVPCFVNLNFFFLSFQMRSHHRHRCWLHLHHVVTDCSFHAMVHSDTRFWLTTSVFYAKSASPVSRWMSPTYLEWTLKLNPTPPLTRIRINELSRIFTRALRIPTRTFAKMFDHWIILLFLSVMKTYFYFYQKIANFYWINIFL